MGHASSPKIWIKELIRRGPGEAWLQFLYKFHISVTYLSNRLVVDQQAQSAPGWTGHRKATGGRHNLLPIVSQEPHFVCTLMCVRKHSSWHSKERDCDQAQCVCRTNGRHGRYHKICATHTVGWEATQCLFLFLLFLLFLRIWARLSLLSLFVLARF